MSNTESEASRRHRRRSKMKEQVSKPDFLEVLMNEFLDESMTKQIFTLVQERVLKNAGFSLKVLAWAVAVFLPTKLHTAKVIAWLRYHATNTVELNANDALTTDLRIWISKQPSSDLLKRLPTFEQLERKDLSCDPKTYKTNKEEGKFQTVVSSSGYIPFFFEGKLLVLHQTEGDVNGWNGSYGKVTLRCLWGSAKPFQALFDAVWRGAKTSHIEIIFVRANVDNQSYNDTKRPMHAVDMDLEIKEELIADLQEFFDPKTEEIQLSARDPLPQRLHVPKPTWHWQKPAYAKPLRADGTCCHISSTLLT